MLDAKNIQALSFDVGGTLIKLTRSVGDVYTDVAAAFGVRGLKAEVLDRQFTDVWKHKEDFDYSQEAWYGLVRKTFGPIAEELPSGFYPIVYQYFANSEIWEVFPDVFPTLNALASRDIPLAIVSNWDNRLRPLLADLKLASYFDVIIPSCEVAFHKPSQVIFEELMRKLGLPAGDILHVGDHFKEDCEGARASGLQTVQLVRNEPSRLPFQISSLSELTSWVHRSEQHLLAGPLKT